MANNIERRKHTRVQARWPATVLSYDGPIEGETRNITVTGMLIRCKEPLRPNKTYLISIRPPNHQAIELTCKVIWSNLHRIKGENTVYGGMGFCFVKVSDEDRHFLSHMISVHPE